MALPTPQPERRRRPRALADFAVTLTVGSTSQEARLSDVSELGLRCHVAQPLRLSTAVTATLQMPGRSQPLQLRAKVVRCMPIDARGSTFTVGLEFAPVAPIDRAALIGYVKKARPAP